MKFYRALVTVFIAILIVLIQPQLTALHFSAKVTNGTKAQVTVSSDDKYPYRSSGQIFQQESNLSNVLNATYKTEILSNKHEAVAISAISQAKDFLHQGKDKYNRGNYEGAIAAYTKAIRLNPNFATAYQNRASALSARANARINLRDTKGAMEDFNRAQEDLNQAQQILTDVLWHVTQAKDRSAQGDYKGAIAAYTKAIRRQPDNVDLYIDLGNARYELKDHQTAIEDYTQAIRLNPNNAFAYFLRGNTHHLLKDYQKAIEDYTQGLRINPNNVIAYRDRGDARASLGDRKGAIEDYTKALQVDPNDADTRKRLDILKAKKATLFFSAILCLVWLISISLHEFGHAIVAYWGGDRSVKAKGYLTLNPLNYTHPLISIILPGLFFLLGAFPLPGAAVYIERQQLRSRLWQSAVVAAGPFASLLLTLLLVVLFQVSSAWDLPYWFLAALAFFISLHLIFILFNLIPVPPLDGYGIIEPWLPHWLQGQLRKFALLWLIFICALPWIAPSFTLLLSGSAFALSDKLSVPKTLALDGFELFNRWYCALLLGAVGVFALIRQPHAAWNFLGDVLSQFEKYELALIAYDKALTLKPGIARIWHQRGWLLEKLGRYDEALTNYNKVIELEPNDAWAWELRGWLLKKLGRYDEALSSCNKAIELRPDNAWTWSRQGWLLKKLKRYEESLAGYDKATKLEPNNAWTWQSRGWLLAESLQRYKDAIESFIRTIQIDPNCYDAWNGLGWALYNLQMHEEAIAAYDKAIQINPSYYLAWHNQGSALKALQQYEKAFESYDKALEIDPKHYYAWYGWYGRGWALHNLQRYKEAITSFDKAIELKPDYDFAWYDRGRSYAQQGNITLAIENLQRAVELNTNRWQELARTDSAFAKIRDNKHFKQLIEKQHME